MTDNVHSFNAIPREPGGKFAKGSPGRPKGAKNKDRAARETIKSYGPAALEKLWSALSTGERWAIEYVLDRILPSGRTVELHGTEPDDLREAVAEGDLTTDEAGKLATALAKVADIDDIQIIKAKLDELEAAINAK